MESKLLDLSRLVIETVDELKSALWKVPDLKLRYDRFWDEEVLCALKMVPYPFPDPVPSTLRSVRIPELSCVEIDWRMMTLLRPRTSVEGDFFTRMVQMARWRLSSSQKDVDEGLFKRMAKRATANSRMSRPANNDVIGDEEDDEDHQDEEEAKLTTRQRTFEYFERRASVEDGLEMETSALMAASRERKERKKRREKKVKKLKKPVSDDVKNNSPAEQSSANLLVGESTSNKSESKPPNGVVEQWLAETGPEAVVKKAKKKTLTRSKKKLTGDEAVSAT